MYLLPNKALLGYFSFPAKQILLLANVTLCKSFKLFLKIFIYLFIWLRRVLAVTRGIFRCGAQASL